MISKEDNNEQLNNLTRISFKKNVPNYPKTDVKTVFSQASVYFHRYLLVILIQFDPNTNNISTHFHNIMCAEMSHEILAY